MPSVLDLHPMNNDRDAHSRSLRRQPVRIDNSDGPWSVSVAETPRDTRSYSIYIKTPTHNLTLTRTASEISELHGKLVDTVQGAKLPVLPIDASQPTIPIKRRSTFLNTLSRLASPAAGKTTRQILRQASKSSPSQTPTPLASPSKENKDPFMSFSALEGSSTSPSTNGSTNAVNGTGLAPANGALTGLAAYLTTISNEPTLRQARVWKRFVRVRTDDLESVRVERAIKRVRSDLAAHVSPRLRDLSSPSANASSVNVTEVESEDTEGEGEDEADGKEMTGSYLREVGIKEEEEEGEGVSEHAHADGDAVDKNDASTVVGEEASVPPSRIDTSVAPADDDDAAGLPTPIATPESYHSRIPRSQSADPDKSSRLSRAYTSSTLIQDSTSSQTEDESSLSPDHGDADADDTSTDADTRLSKKRSRSADPSRSLKKKPKRKVVIDDFEMMRVLGKGCAGKVLLVKHKLSADLYALKAITKRHVLAHQELQHTLTEQAVLKRMAAEARDPFVVKLWWSFHDKENLFLVMDFHPGGDLATQLARWGRLGRDRARFYAAEIVEGVEGLHAAGVIYRDLKPENILIGADGHIVLTDFGLSKEFPRRANPITAPSTPSTTRGEFYSASPGSEPVTPPWMRSAAGGGERHELAVGWPGQGVAHVDTTSTFCGTAEYLAPEVIQGLPYSYEVDWWSFGTMLYEMLTGITPFWANNHSDMYVRVLQDELQFPDDRAIDQDTKSLIRGLLQRNPALRICEPRIKRHPYFSMIDWSHVYYKRYIPPYIPPIDPSNASDTQNFDETFLDMEPVIDDPNDVDQTDVDADREQTDVERTDEESNTTPSQSRSPSVHPMEDTDVFDGYSFKGRYSVILDDDEEEEGEGQEEEEGVEEDVASKVEINGSAEQVVGDGEVVGEEREPKTPEARPPASLPQETPKEVPVKGPVTLNGDASAPQPSTPRASKELPIPHTPTSSAKDRLPLVPKDAKARVTKVVPVAPRPTSYVGTRNRREKSGVPALDRFLSDSPDEDVDATEKEDEDDDWDFIDAVDGEDRNGSKGTSLFARGVVDRYRLAVFRKASTPSRSGLRSVSGMSKDSDLNGTDAGESPSPSHKQRRGRTPGLNFRKHPRQFLRAKSPTTKSFSQSTTSATMSTASSLGLLTPPQSTTGTLPLSPSLKSKESAISVGTRSASSDQSNGDFAPLEAIGLQEPSKAPAPSAEEPEKIKNKKLKKYKEGAEKVLSLFASPRQLS